MPVGLDDLAPFLPASVLVTVVSGVAESLVTHQLLVGGPPLAQRTMMDSLAGLTVRGVKPAVGLSAPLVASVERG